MLGGICIRVPCFFPITGWCPPPELLQCILTHVSLSLSLSCCVGCISMLRREVQFRADPSQQETLVAFVHLSPQTPKRDVFIKIKDMEGTCMAQGRSLCLCSGHIPRVLGSSLALGSLQGACFFLCLFGVWGPRWTKATSVSC